MVPVIRPINFRQTVQMHTSQCSLAPSSFFRSGEQTDDVEHVWSVFKAREFHATASLCLFHRSLQSL